MSDYYSVLGLSRTATHEDIKAAYRRQAVRYHPDLSREPNCTERFNELTKAYGILSDPAAKASYDIRLASPVPPSEIDPFSYAPDPDPIYEMLKRHQDAIRNGTSKSSRFSAASTTSWEERKQFWEAEKKENAAYKERRSRVHSRMHRSHTARIARILSAQWPAQAAVTRQDMLFGSFFVVGCAAMSAFWLQPENIKNDCARVSSPPHGVPSQVVPVVEERLDSVRAPAFLSSRA